MDRCPDVLVDPDGLIGTPDEAATEEREEEEDTIIELWFRARHVYFVKEPVEVEERGGELVEDKCRPIEVDKRSLYHRISH